MKYSIIYVSIIFLFFVFYKNNDILNIIQMYKSKNTIVNVLTKGGLGNRLMSFAGIIVLSIIFKSKPFRIFLYTNIDSNRLERF